MVLRLVASYEELEANPVGCALGGRSFLTWCATSRLTGTVHFGCRDTDDARTLAKLYGLANHRALERPLRRVVDGRMLHDIDADAWNQMATTMADSESTTVRVFERQAVIVAPGVDGARTAALLPAFGPNDKYRVFVEPVEAYQWADAENGLGAFHAVEALRNEVASVGDLVVKANAWVAKHLREARIDRCAKALGVSSRSLQRAFSASNQTFRTAVASARAAAASVRLLESDAKIEVVARAVGCSSASQLGVLLRRAGLPTPSKLRASRRE